MSGLLCACGDWNSGPGDFCGAPQTVLSSTVYVANNINGTGTVSRYTIDATNGTLLPVPTAITAGANPNSIVVTPGAEGASSPLPIGGQPFVYVANSASANVSGYSIAPFGGSLSALAGSPFPAGVGLPRSLAVHGSGKFLYLASSNANVVSAFSINSTTGALTAVGTLVSAGADPMSIAVGGNFAYTANSTSNDVSAFVIDSTTGALSGVGTPVAAGVMPQAIVVEPTVRFAYVANFSSNDLSAYSIDPTTGTLTSLGTNVPAGAGPISLAVMPAQAAIAIVPAPTAFLYVANFNSNDILVYSIGATGALTPVGLPVATGTNPRALSFDPDGRFLYVVNFGSANISAYSINPATGALTNIGTTVSAEANPFAITTKRRSAVVTPC